MFRQQQVITVSLESSWLMTQKLALTRVILLLSFSFSDLNKHISGDVCLCKEDSHSPAAGVDSSILERQRENDWSSTFGLELLTACQHPPARHMYLARLWCLELVWGKEELVFELSCAACCGRACVPSAALIKVCVFSKVCVCVTHWLPLWTLLWHPDMFHSHTSGTT